ncbi:MAG: class I SAM-dependent methyltransferase [Actinomycetota bacterium]
MPDLARLYRETLGSSYYRSRPLDGARYVATKGRLARHRASPDDIIGGLGFDVLAARAGLDRWSAPLGKMLDETAQVAEEQHEQGAMALEGALLLYGLVRSVRPTLIIETGVASGVSTSFIGAALLENGHGELVSIDLPPHASKIADGGEFDWISKPVGWAIPDEIRTGLGDRHELILEDVRTALPRVLSERRDLDMFVHDDLHTPDHMYWEFELVWPHLRPGGVVMSDDINQGWLDFADEVGLGHQALPNTQRLAAIRKPV